MLLSVHWYLVADVSGKTFRSQIPKGQAVQLENQFRRINIKFAREMLEHTFIVVKTFTIYVCVCAVADNNRSATPCGVRPSEKDARCKDSNVPQCYISYTMYLLLNAAIYKI
jgi:hypothetical protein